MPSPRRWLASLADASLSKLGIWPAADRDSGPGAPPGAAEHAVGLDRRLRLASATHAAARAGSGRRIAVLDHNARTTAAARDTARKARAGTLPTRSPMPPISGHGAPSMVKVTDLRLRLGAPESLELPLRAFAFRRDARSIPGRGSGPRSSPVNSERRRSRPSAIHRSDAGFEAHRHQAHMETFLGVALLAKEVLDGKKHTGHIDTLGLDQNGCPSP